MSIDSKHPAYTLLLEDWEIMIDSHAGERTVKEKGLTYLPATSGMVADGMTFGQKGLLAYTSYKIRARFPDAVETAVSALVGVMHSKPPTIELPTSMEPLREVATNRGESLEVLLRRINEAQLITGRIGLLLDVQTGQDVGTLPYISTYEATDILNWDDGSANNELVLSNLNLVVLDESGEERDNNFQWTHVDKFRILVLGDVTVNEADTDTSAKYGVAVVKGQSQNFDQSQLIEPSLGGRTLEFIPFTFINASDVVATPDKPPLLGLAALSMGIYRGEADYRQALFMQGQDTLVVAGGSDPDASYRTGAGAVINLVQGGTAEFIGVDSTGLSEMRSALENDKAEAAQKSGTMVEKSSIESGDALRIRVVARTATLNQLAKTGAFGLQTSLRQLAVWTGANPDEVIVTANLDFVNDTLGGEELVKLATAKSLGAPISTRSIHKQMEEKGLTELTLEEELQEIEDEVPMGGSSSEGLPDGGDEEGGSKHLNEDDEDDNNKA